MWKEKMIIKDSEHHSDSKDLDLDEKFEKYRNSFSSFLFSFCVCKRVIYQNSVSKINPKVLS